MKKSKDKKLFALRILIDHCENWMWLLYILLASVSAIIHIFNNGFVFDNGELLFISMSIIAPLLVDFVIENLEYREKNEQHKFLKKKSMAIGICLLILIMSFVFLQTNLKRSLITQLIIYFISIGTSLYMFCLQKLAVHYEEYKEMDDISYDQQIKKGSEELINNKNLDVFHDDDGKEIKL